MSAHPAKPPQATALAIVRRLQHAGFSAFWVGGCVRDFLLGREPGDYDIASSARPEQIEKLFRRTIPVGRKFGVMVVVESRRQFEVATFRAEADYQDGRRPGRVTFGDAMADARRRDFTVNGLFYDPVARQLHDWVGGEADLRARIIRTIGAPAERFAEDHLRLLRAVRFAAQLDFTIQPETFAALKATAPKIKTTSAERIREELVKLFCPPHAARGLELLRESGLLEQVLPEIAATVTCEQSPDYHPEGTVFNHLRLMLQHLPAQPDPLLPWAVLLHDVAKPLTAAPDPKTGSIHFYGHEKVGAEMAAEILKRLRFPRKHLEQVVQAVRHHMQFKDALEMRKSTLRRLILRPTFPLELALHRLDCLGSHGGLTVHDYLLAQARELEHQPQLLPPLLTGHDLIALGMKPGPALGALLAEIREKQLQEELKTRAEARQWARKRLARAAGGRTAMGPRAGARSR
ncbi:MAG TPA: CCA tRNA nucleotidyltransferase [Candidatus Paceibacterota bacterium]|nr:CCA tRNA nucleotidyltransferase [Verrucomicrobiota bacterium]HSA08885.1 CCA tRNA nucleotidyltransferase [Candidatus Paceibacterota bacterium]